MATFKSSASSNGVRHYLFEMGTEIGVRPHFILAFAAKWGLTLISVEAEDVFLFGLFHAVFEVIVPDLGPRTGIHVRHFVLD